MGMKPDMSLEQAMELLDLKTDFTEKEFKTNYRKLMMSIHPDTLGNLNDVARGFLEEKAKDVNVAKGVIEQFLKVNYEREQSNEKERNRRESEMHQRQEEERRKKDSQEQQTQEEENGQSKRKHTNYTEEQILNVLEKAIEDAMDKVMGEGTKEEIKSLLAVDDSQVYQKLLNTMLGMKVRQGMKGKFAASKATVNARLGVIAATEGLETNPTIWAKVKAFIAFVVRKTAALLKGTFSFVFDVMVGNTTKESIYTSQYIGAGIRKDAIDALKLA